MADYHDGPRAQQAKRLKDYIRLAASTAAEQPARHAVVTHRGEIVPSTRSQYGTLRLPTGRSEATESTPPYPGSTRDGQAPSEDDLMSDKTTSSFPKMGNDAVHGMRNVSATGSEPHVYRGVRQTQVPRTSGLSRAPVPNVPEKQSNVYERIVAPNTAGKVGPSRFEEGLGADPTVPTNFVGGILAGYVTPPGQPGHNIVQKKYADGRGAFGRTSPPPTWDAVRGAELAAFAQGHGNPQWLVEQTDPQEPLRVGTDMSRVSLEERPRMVIDRAIASNDDRNRPNAASGYRAGENQKAVQ